MLFSFFILFVAFRMRSGRHFVVFSISFKVHSRTVLKPGGQGKSRRGRFKLRSQLKDVLIYFSLKISYYTALRPGKGARALRFHDLSRRAQRVVGRSDAVLHRFGEAQPSRNGCIVVRPLPLTVVVPVLKCGANVISS